MASEKEKEDLLDIKAEVDYIKVFIEVAEGWADEAHIDEVYELEVPCRAAAHHAKDILNLLLSAHNEVVEELAGGASSMKEYLSKIKNRL